MDVVEGQPSASTEVARPMELPFAMPVVWAAWVGGPSLLIVTSLWEPTSESFVAWLVFGHGVSAVLCFWLLAVPGSHRRQIEFELTLGYFVLTLAYLVCVGDGMALSLAWWLLLSMQLLAVAVPAIALGKAVRRCSLLASSPPSA
jgi:hypothetical protein